MTYIACVWMRQHHTDMYTANCTRSIHIEQTDSIYASCRRNKHLTKEKRVVNMCEECSRLSSKEEVAPPMIDWLSTNKAVRSFSMAVKCSMEVTPGCFIANLMYATHAFLSSLFAADISNTLPVLPQETVNRKSRVDSPSTHLTDDSGVMWHVPFRARRLLLE